MKVLLITLAALIMSLPIIGFAQSNTPPASADKIDWPAEYDPAKSKFFVHNEIEINARPEVVWPILIDALKWPTWYKGAKDLVLINAGDNLLGAHSVFRWQTMGLTFESTIKAYEPNQLLAWESKKKSIQGYHVWLILPTAAGCKVITEESQNGWLTFFEKTFQGKKLKRLHDVWLSKLKMKAEQGDTGSLYDPNVPNGLTQAERQGLMNQLQMSLAKFNVTVADLSPEQFSFKAKSDKWTLAECIEHVTLAELHFPKILAAAMQTPANPAFRDRIRVTNETIQPLMTSRTWRAKSPKVFKPSGRFTTAEASIAQLQTQRKETISYVAQTTDDLKNHYWRHPLTGPIDLYQTLLLMSAHLERHIAQMAEIKSSTGFPK